MSWLSIIRSFTIKSCFLISIRISIESYNAGVEGRLVEMPENQVVNLGKDVIFKCRTSSKESVDWYFQRQGKAEVNVFIGRTGGGGDMSSDYVQKKRVQVKMVIAKGQYDLVISNVTATDEGNYSCFDISDPSIAGSASLVIVGKEALRCDAAVLKGEEQTLSFQTLKNNSIQLEHLSFSKDYPLHVFNDKRIVNDYALSGRFSVHVDISTGTWNLTISNVQMEDAGTYIFSEDNGLGGQQHKEITVIRKSDQQNTTECERNCTVYYSGRCPPRLEWRLLANEADTILRVLSSRKIVHNDISVSVILDEPIEELEPSRPVCSIVIHPEDRTSHLKIQDCNFSPQHSQLKEPAFKVPLTVILIGLFIALAVAVVVGVYYKREKLRTAALGFLSGLFIRQKTPKRTPSIIEASQRTKDVFLEIAITPIRKSDAGKCNSIRKRTPRNGSSKTIMAKSNTVRSSSFRRILNYDFQNLH